MPMFKPQPRKNNNNQSTRHVNSDVIDVQVRFLINDPTIAKDPKKTPTTIFF